MCKYAADPTVSSTLAERDHPILILNHHTAQTQLCVIFVRATWSCMCVAASKFAWKHANRYPFSLIDAVLLFAGITHSIIQKQHDQYLSTSLRIMYGALGSHVLVQCAGTMTTVQRMRVWVCVRAGECNLWTMLADVTLAARTRLAATCWPATDALGCASERTAMMTSCRSPDSCRCYYFDRRSSRRQRLAHLLKYTRHIPLTM